MLFFSSSKDENWSAALASRHFKNKIIGGKWSRDGYLHWRGYRSREILGKHSMKKALCFFTFIFWHFFLAAFCNLSQDILKYWCYEN
jgi:hypothetical protein